MNKTINLLVANLGLTLLASSWLASPVKANLIPETKSESLEELQFDFRESLLSQLLGHDVYKGDPQIEWNGYMLGRVVAKVGNILFVKLPDGSHFQDTGSARPGNDVLVEEVDGKYYVVQTAHSAWISHLEADYGWRRITAVENLNERTAAIWSELESASSAPVVTSPPTTSTPSYTPVEQPTMNEPVRGLY